MFLYKYGLAILLCCVFANCTSTKLSSTSSILDLPENTEGEQASKESPINKEMPPLNPGEVEFFKLQVVETASYEEILREREKLTQYTNKVIFIVNENADWKIQIGDYFSKEIASNDRDTFRSLGWVDTKLVQYRSTVNKNIPTSPQDIPAQIENKAVNYTVQVIATSNKNEAENLKRNLEKLNIKNSFLVTDNNLWKIQVGEYKTYDEARGMLGKLKEMGFNDSWVTKKK